MFRAKAKIWLVEDYKTVQRLGEDARSYIT